MRPERPTRSTRLSLRSWTTVHRYASSGPDGEASGVGLRWEGEGATGYGTGPQLVGAKSSTMSAMRRPAKAARRSSNRDCCPTTSSRSTVAAIFACACWTSGGFTPTGITGLTPDAYERHFRIHATAEDGSTVLLSEIGVDYEVAGARCESLDSLILVSHLAMVLSTTTATPRTLITRLISSWKATMPAISSITHVEVPSSGEYQPLYNPGGPGPEPFPDVRYTEPSPHDLEPVIIALDDPLRVSNVP